MLSQAPADDFVSLGGEPGRVCVWIFLWSAMGIMGSMEDIGRIVSPNSKNVNIFVYIASSLSLFNYNSKPIVLCD